jgi:hypothetical protein
MHQTTVRFSPDLWMALEEECSQLGISAAQFLREAAVARLSYAAGQRGNHAYDDALVAAGVLAAEDSHSRAAAVARDHAADELMSASAVTAQSEHLRQ